MALKENSKNIMNYVKEHDGEDFVSADIAAALGLTTKQVDGSVTAFAKKDLMVREAAEIEVEDGKHKTVKFIRLTDAGRAFDVNCEAEAAAE